MEQDLFKQNEDFLKSKGIILLPTGSMFNPYDYQDETYYMVLSEYSQLQVLNKKTGKGDSIHLSSKKLDEDFFSKID